MKKELCTREINWTDIRNRLNPVVYQGGGGGGLFGSTIRLLTITQKRLNLASPNLATFSFYLLGTFSQNFSKIS